MAYKRLTKQQQIARDAKIWELRQKGYTFDAISKELSVPLTTVWDSNTRTYGMRRDQLIEKVEEKRGEEVDALDVQISRLTLMIDALEDAAEPWMFRELLKFRESRRLLLGLNMPERIEISATVMSPADVELAELNRELMQAGMVGDPTLISADIDSE